MTLDALSLRTGIREQGRIVYALIMRDIRVRFGQHRVGFAWAIIEPAIHISVLYGLRTILGGVAPLHIPLLLWLLSGVVPMLMFRGIFQKVGTAIRTSKDALLLPRIQAMDIIWARSLLEFGIYVTLLLFMLLMYAVLVDSLKIANPIGVFAGLVMLVLLGLSGGMIAMVMTSIFPSTQPLISAVLRLLYFTSGVLFSPSRLPSELHPYLSWNPVLHVFEYLHAAFFESYIPLAGCHDMGYVALWIIGMFVLGVLLKNRFMRLLLES